MKKIEIITLSGNYNYGNRLQNYAMQEVYKKLGFERFATEPMAIYDGKQYYDEDMMRFYL